MHPTDHIQIVTFRLAGLTRDDYAAHCEAVAPQFTQIDGLRAKAWIADARTNTYGGIYAWESEEAMEAYVHGPVFGALRSNPAARRRVLEGLHRPRARPPASPQRSAPRPNPAPADSWAA